MCFNLSGDLEVFGLWRIEYFVGQQPPYTLLGRIGVLCSGERAGLLRKFFGNDGQKQLTLEAFKGFMDALREELVRLEYQYYDCESKVR